MVPTKRSHSRSSFLRNLPHQLALLVGCSLLLSGCIHRTISGPSTPPALLPPRDQVVRQQITNFYCGECIYDNASTGGTSSTRKTSSSYCGSRKEQRNTIIYELKSIIDQNYEGYARAYQQTADITTFGGEVAGASLTAVGTLVGATDLKDILTTASTLTQSTTVSIQKNFYQKQTEYAILAEMDADRATKWLAIVKLMKQPVSEYPLSAALDDLLEYKRVGTATAALTAITQHAGVKANQAKQKTINTRVGPPVPALTVKKTHDGDFKAGQQGATYSIKVSNSPGAAPTSGLVTVTDTLPAGLTLVKMEGQGWNCSHNSCTRNSILDGDSSYPVITVTVNVKASASGTLFNQVAVSGRDSRPATDADATIITAAGVR